MMDERQFSELRKLLAEMPTGDLTRIKKDIRAELDRRGKSDKRIVHPLAAWDDLLTRNGNNG